MKPSAPSGRTKVTAENLAGLGAERLAEILVGVAETRADLKRRLRMELAAEQGPAALTAAIDRRLGSLESSRGQIGWRQRPAFIRDHDALRDLIVQRLTPLDVAAAVDRLWRFLDVARQSASRHRERDGELDQVFERAAAALGGLLSSLPPGPAAASLVESIEKNPAAWKRWLPALLAQSSMALAEDGLRFMMERRGAVPGWIMLVRQLADAAGDLDAVRATYSGEALSTPAVASEMARRYLAAERIEEAGAVLRGAAPKLGTKPGRTVEPDAEWETLWIDYLERSGRGEEAQAIRWASFERTLSAERVRAFISRLGDFDDVEAEGRAFEVASRAADAARGLRFLMDWPALTQAAALIERRGDELQPDVDAAELWAAKLRRRYPRAAHVLLRRAAAAAFKRRDYKTCDRLTAEAEAITL